MLPVTSGTYLIPYLIPDLIPGSLCLLASFTHPGHLLPLVATPRSVLKWTSHWSKVLRSWVHKLMDFTKKTTAEPRKQALTDPEVPHPSQPQLLPLPMRHAGTLFSAMLTSLIWVNRTAYAPLRPAVTAKYRDHTHSWSAPCALELACYCCVVVSDGRALCGSCRRTRTFSQFPVFSMGLLQIVPLKTPLRMALGACMGISVGSVSRSRIARAQCRQGWDHAPECPIGSHAHPLLWLSAVHWFILGRQAGVWLSCVML